MEDAAVTGHIQSVSAEHWAFLHLPSEQVRPEVQSEVTEQVVLQLSGVGLGVGDAIGLADGLALGVAVGEALGLAEASVSVNVSVQFDATWAPGLLVGAVGAIGCWRSWYSRKAVNTATPARTRVAPMMITVTIFFLKKSPIYLVPGSCFHMV